MTAETETDLRRQRESIAIRAWLAVAVGLGTAAFLALSMTGLFFYDRWAAPNPEVPTPISVPEPRLQSDPAGELRELQAQQRQQLEGYAWIDREHGLVRIPVARAMEILARRGSAAFAPLEAPDPNVPLPVRPEAARRGRP
jgi:hypothetical protein